VEKYFFIVSGPDELHDDGIGTPLPNDAAARAYAERIIKELKEAGGYDDPYLTMIVKNERRQTVFTILFTPDAGAINGGGQKPYKPSIKRD